MAEKSDDSSRSEASATLVFTKIGAMLVLGVGSLVLGTLPLMVGRCRFGYRDKRRAVSSGNSSTLTKTSFNIDNDASSQVRIEDPRGLPTSLLLCFGGGVLLFTTFLHLAPEVRQSVERHQSTGQLTSLGTLSMAELLFCAGFFLVYLVEETVRATLTSKPEASEDLLRRTVSVRRCNERPSTSVSTTTISTVTAPTSSGDETSASWQIGRTGHSGGEEDAERDVEVDGIGQRQRQLHRRDGRALFPRSTNSHESSNRSGELAPRAFEDTSEEPIDVATMEFAVATTPAADTSVRGLLAVAALSFHAIFEGLAVGLEPSMSSVVYLAAAIATHKLVIAFCVGTELYVAGATSRTILGCLAVFSLVSPLGIGVGLALGHFKNDSENLGPTPTILQGMAAGTLLYVVFFEVLARERANDKSGLLQLAAIILGFVLMLGLQLATAHSHSHSHGHSHGSGEDHAHHTGQHEEDEDDHDHDHSRHSEVRPINDAIERITESVAEAVSNVMASSSLPTTRPASSA